MFSKNWFSVSKVALIFWYSNSKYKSLGEDGTLVKAILKVMIWNPKLRIIQKWLKCSSQSEFCFKIFLQNSEILFFFFILKLWQPFKPYMQQMSFYSMENWYNRVEQTLCRYVLLFAYIVNYKVVLILILSCLLIFKFTWNQYLFML